MLNDVYLLKVISSQRQFVDEIELIYSNYVVNNIHVQISSTFKKIIVKNYQKNKI